MRNAFGTYLVPPSQLTPAEKVGLLEQAARTLTSGALDAYTADWFADAIRRVLAEGITLDEALGLRPPQGSHATPANVTRQRHRDSLLVRLAVAAGGDACALRVLHGVSPCPVKACALVDQLRAYTLPRSAATLTRARQRLARHAR